MEVKVSELAPTLVDKLLLLVVILFLHLDYNVISLSPYAVYQDLTVKIRHTIIVIDYVSCWRHVGTDGSNPQSKSSMMR